MAYKGRKPRKKPTEELSQLLLEAQFSARDAAFAIVKARLHHDNETTLTAEALNSLEETESVLDSMQSWLRETAIQVRHVGS